MTSSKLFAIVREQEAKVPVKTLSQEEITTLGDFGLEMMAAEYCQQRKLTFLDYSFSPLPERLT